MADEHDTAAGRTGQDATQPTAQPGAGEPSAEEQQSAADAADFSASFEKRLKPEGGEDAGAAAAEAATPKPGEAAPGEPAPGAAPAAAETAKAGKATSKVADATLKVAAEPADTIQQAEERAAAAEKEAATQAREAWLDDLTAVHQDAEQVIGSRAFDQWADNQPPETRNKIDGGCSAQEAAAILTDFKAAQKAQGAEPAVDVAGLPEIQVENDAGEKVAFTKEYGQDVMRQAAAIAQHLQEPLVKELRDIRALAERQGQVIAGLLFDTKLSELHADARTVMASPEWAKYADGLTQRLKATLAARRDPETVGLIVSGFKKQVADAVKGVQRERKSERDAVHTRTLRGAPAAVVTDGDGEPEQFHDAFEETLAKRKARDV